MKEYFFKKNQNGAVIIVSLFVLLLVTLLALTIANRSTLLQRMAGNAQNFNSSFQAAENGFEVWLREFRASEEDVSLIISKNGVLPDNSEYEVHNLEFVVYEDEGHSISAAEDGSTLIPVYTEVISEGKFDDSNSKHYIGYASRFLNN